MGLVVVPLSPRSAACIGNSSDGLVRSGDGFTDESLMRKRLSMEEKKSHSKLKYVMIAFVLVCGCNTDLYTKQLATEFLEAGGPVPLVKGYLDLRYTENRNAAFSLLSNVDPELRRPLLTGLQVTVSLVLCALVLLWRKQRFYALLPYLFVLAGGLGNAIDRVWHGHVVDFIHFHVHDRFHWPVFNVADILIAVGAGLLILQLLTSSAPLPVRIKH